MAISFSMLRLMAIRLCAKRIPSASPSAQDSASRPTPFLPVVVLAMMGDDNSQTENAKQWRNKSGSDAVNVHDLRPANSCHQRADQRVQQRLEIGIAYGPQPKQPYSLPFLTTLRVTYGERTQAVTRCPMLDELRGEIFDVRLDTALDTRKAAKPEYIDLTFAHCACSAKRLAIIALGEKVVIGILADANAPVCRPIVIQRSNLQHLVRRLLHAT